jgi:hypothetical protein
MLSHLLAGVPGLDSDADIFSAVQRALHGEHADGAYDVRFGIVGVDDHVYRVFMLSEGECRKASSALETQGLVQRPGTDFYRALFKLV